MAKLSCSSCWRSGRLLGASFGRSDLSRDPFVFAHEDLRYDLGTDGAFTNADMVASIFSRS